MSGYDFQIRDWREFHPRAVKLLERHKPFLVIANDEPYYMQVYRLIRKNEKIKGTWSDEDEREYQAAQQERAADGSKSLAGSPVILDDTLAKDETRMFRRR